MNNLHRELAPISAAAWADLEAEARRTFTLNVAARRVVDVAEPAGPELAAVNTGHLDEIHGPADGVVAHRRRSQPVVELWVPFTLDRRQIDDVERGAMDPDWQPVKDAARRIAFAEDRTVFEGYAAAAIAGMRQRSSNPALPLPANAGEYPALVGQALAALRLAGVGGPYALVLGAEPYTAMSEAAVYGNPVRDHVDRVLDGEIVVAPAIDGGFLLSTRGGDFDLRLGQDLSIGYLSHDATTVQLYFQETLTFLAYTGEAVVPLNAG